MTNIPHCDVSYKPQQWLRSILLGIFGIGIVVHFSASLHGNWNWDEFQYVKNGWATTRGLRPYRDFWDNHGLLSNYFYALPFRYLPAVHESLFVFRILAYALTLGVVALTAWAGRLAFPSRKHIGLTTAALLVSSELFLLKAREVRGDNVMNLCWMATIGLILLGLRTNKTLMFLAGGLMLGAAGWFSIKMSMLAVSAALIVLSAWRKRSKLHARQLGALLIGSAVMLAIQAGVLAYLGLFYDFVRQAVFSNVTRDHKLAIGPLTSAFKTYPFWMGIGFAAIVQAIARDRARRADDGERWLWPAAAFLLFQYFFLLPSKHLQSLLPAHPLIALLGANMLLTMLDWLHARWGSNAAFRAVMVVVAGVIAHTYHLVQHNQYVNGAPELYVKSGNRLQSLTRPDEYVLTGLGVPLFRLSPIATNSMVNYLQEAYRKGTYKLRLREALVKKRVRFIVYDARLRSLPIEDREFIRENYCSVVRPLKRPPLLVAGNIRAVGGCSTVTLDTRIPGWYWVSVISSSHTLDKRDETSAAVFRVYSKGESIAIAVPDDVTSVVYTQIAPWRVAVESADFISQ